MNTMPTTNATWWSRWSASSRRDPAGPMADSAQKTSPFDDGPPSAGETDGMQSLVETMLAQHRYALLLRRQVADSLSEEQQLRARDHMERSMAPISAGVVDLNACDREARDAGDAEDDGAGEETRRSVESLHLDRHPVTNRQFRQFVEAGGYELPPLWDAQIWPAVAGFVDATGCRGPRFWRGGKYPSGEDEHPVVGVSWHEAAAYARWVGKRLPTDAEWLKAAACPIALADGRHWQRRFPWGEAMDRGRCNLWGSGPSRSVEITQFSSGVSVGGVHQLIGNVWEWTGGDFEAVDSHGAPLELPAPMKSIRGGAFDTYFEQQAASQFCSGENPLSRKHNIGFRCALSQCDVAQRRGGDGENGAAGDCSAPLSAPGGAS